MRGRGGSRRPVPGDLVAGVSVALLAIPQSMAYAELAGLPAHHGLYAAALPPIAAACFASSRYLQTGPVALTSLLTLGALAPLAARGSTHYVELAALLALVVGVRRVGLGLLRAGVVAFLMSEPVLRGFTSAAAVLIVCSQLPSALGVEAPVDGVLAGAWWGIRHVELWDAPSVLLAALTVAIIFGARRLHPLVPGVLLATAIGIAYSQMVDYSGPTLGVIPDRLPPVGFDFAWSGLRSLILPGIVIALVGFAEPAAISRTLAARDRESWNPDREFVSQGVANVVSGLASGFPVGGSFSRSNLNRMAGAKTRWSGAVTGAAVIFFLPFAPVLSPLPRAVLSAIVIAAGAGLIRVQSLRGLWRFSPPQALVAYVTFALTLGLAPHIEQAILLGVLLSVAVHLWRELTPTVRSWTEGKSLHLEPQGVLWFGSAPSVETAFLKAISQHDGLDRVVIHLGGLGRLDLTGALTLGQLLDDAAAAGLDAQLVEVPPHAARILGSCLGWKSEGTAPTA